MATSPNSSILLAPRVLCQRSDSVDGLECSVHTLPKPLLREFRHVFADKYLTTDGVLADDGLDILALPTNQHAKDDLVAIGEHIEAEKDRLLNVVSGS